MIVNCYRRFTLCLSFIFPLSVLLASALVWYVSLVSERQAFLGDVDSLVNLVTKLNNIDEKLEKSVRIKHASPIVVIPLTHSIYDISDTLIKSSNITPIQVHEIQQTINRHRTAYEILKQATTPTQQQVHDYTIQTLEIGDSVRKHAIAVRVTLVNNIKANTNAIDTLTTYLGPILFCTLLIYGYLIGFILFKLIIPLKQAAQLLTKHNELPVNFSSITSNTLELSTLFSAVENSHLQITQAKKLSDQVARDKVNYINFLSHELRTPLNSMIENAYILRKTHEIDELDDLYAGSLHLKEIINGILDKTKLDFTQQVKVEETKLSAVLDKIALNVKHLQSQYRSYGVIEIDDNVPMRFISDPFIIQQVLINLVTNTIKYSESDAYKIKVRYRSNVLICKIIDNGKGMSRELVNTIFKSYTQESNNMDSSGLGMSIVRDLLSPLRGEVYVQSTIGRGTVFTTLIPIEHANTITTYKDYLAKEGTTPYLLSEYLSKYTSKFRKQAPHSSLVLTSNLPDTLFVPLHSHQSSRNCLTPTDKKSIQFKSLTGLKILLAEDYELNIRLMSRFAKKHKLSMEIVRNGEEAVNKALTSKFDLILMDFKMPVMDGLSASKIIRQSISKEDLPILILTANTQELQSNEEVDKYVNGFLQKPITLAQLTTEIAKRSNHE